jgi:GDP-L-fucose synthase
MKVFLAGHNGMVGAAIHRLMDATGRFEIITSDSKSLNLTDQNATREFMAHHRPDVVVLAAAKVGGIHANNSYPADFIYENIAIACNVIHQAHCFGVERLLQLGSSCIYPRNAPQPMHEEHLLTGTLEPTNEPYAIAKIAGIKLCESYNRQYGRDYRSVMPSNLYGQGDNFHPENSHVLPALLRRFHEAVVSGADTVTIWGSGKPLREFLHVDDLANACLFVLELDRPTYEAHTSPMNSHINAGSGVETSIGDLAGLMAKITGFHGEVRFDSQMPDGAPRKLLDTSRLSDMGWTAQIGLEAGVRATYEWFLETLQTNAGLRQR